MFTSDSTPRGHEYGAYLWFFRLAGQDSNPGIVRAMWQAGAGVTSLEAIESTLRASGLGGFETQWPHFALQNWNREAPYRKYFEWDRLDHKAVQEEYTVRLEGSGLQHVEMGYDLPILSASYQRWDFSQDDGIRSIRFTNSDPGRQPNARIHALVKIRDQPWKEAEDWTNVPEKNLCRDRAAEDVEEIVFVVTNVGYRQSDGRVQDGGALSLMYSGLPCHDFTGTTEYVEERTGGGAVEATRATGTGLRFRQDPQNPALWVAIEGTINVSYDATSPFEDGSCTSHGRKQFSAKDGARFALFPTPDGIDFFGVTAAFPLGLQLTVTCSSSLGTFTYVVDDPIFGVEWFFTGPDLRSLGTPVTTIHGEYSNDDRKWSWNLVKG